MPKPGTKYQRLWLEYVLETSRSVQNFHTSAPSSLNDFWRRVNHGCFSRSPGQAPNCYGRTTISKDKLDIII